jgi:thymidylate synthase
MKKNRPKTVLPMRDPNVEFSMDEFFRPYGVPKRAISLMWNQRSVDTFLGLPFNIASYGLLLEIIAKTVNMVPDQLIGNLGDVHLYSNHIEQAKEQIGRYLTDEERYNIWFNNNYETGMERFFDPDNLPDYNNEYYEPTPKRTREPFPLPKLVMNPIFLANLEHKSFNDAINGEVNFRVENYQSHPPIKAPLSN